MPLVKFFAAVLALATLPTDAAEIRVVPTFECAGLYWKASGGADDVKCDVRYRELSAA
ncbi:hypothetical protein [Fuerstiella marisgermanici]|uniref:Uncharacterized protein n=1 Tax=Fuerstiella marisgermanici TaxID=1891926 RepID=A0A1P8WFS3_9PLAN|nr:hypothetical protein [Fuerstiella marisgermanici]APZ92915.1 hypothetical protein Fuma_02527 [Fuerstiella marisgermanici]